MAEKGLSVHMEEDKRASKKIKPMGRIRCWLLRRLGAEGRAIAYGQETLYAMFRLGKQEGRRGQPPVVYLGNCPHHPEQRLIERPDKPGSFDCPMCLYLRAERHTDPLTPVQQTPHSGDTGVIEAIKAGQYPAGTLARAYHARHVGVIGDDTRKVRRVLLRQVEQP